MIWKILYRGPLSSCNYSCDYCPFAKTKNTRAELLDDKQKLKRFVEWIKDRKENVEILFAPWGEALIRNYYQEAMTELSHLPNVKNVTIQTNLTCDTKWMSKVNKNTFSLWTTFHPSQISLEKFTEKCKELDDLNVRYSVGFVALKEDISILQKLRSLINEDVYIWANAYKRVPNYYTQSEIETIKKVDPLFDINNKFHPSKGKDCSAGNTSFSVDGDGNITRCNFIKGQITNIYSSAFEKHLKPRKCINKTCHCYIGYIHLKELQLENTYQSIWGRIPVEFRRKIKS